MEQNTPTQGFYAYEERGRGWRVYDLPVDLEPPCEPPEFLYSPPAIETGFDDGKRPTIFGRALQALGLATTNRPIEEPKDNEGLLSYPDNPALFTSDSSLRSFGVSLPKGTDVSPVEAEQLLQMLSSTVYPIAFEIIGLRSGIFVQWTCREEDAERLVSQLRSYFPEAAVTEHGQLDIPLDEHVPIAITDLGLSQEFIRPLQDSAKFTPDPLVGILAAFEYLADGEMGMLQVLFKGSQNPWASIIKDIASDGQGGSFFENAPEFPKLAEEKTASPLYGVVVRVIGQGRTKERSDLIAKSLAESVSVTTRSPHNSLIPLSNKYYPYDDRVEAFLDRSTYRLGMLLNSKELVTLVHLPSASVATHKLQRQVVKTKHVPRALTDGLYAIGGNEHLSGDQTVWLTDEQRLKHMHIIGATGTGKSTFLTNLFLQDCDRGNGCIVFDPHGDLIDDIIPRIGEERLKDVILIDPSDTEYPIGFNLLEAKTDLEKNILSSDLVETFKANSIVWGDTINSVLIQAVNAFLESKKGGTLLELRKFLLDAKFRHGILATIEDPTIRSYWQHEFPQLKKGSLSPLLTRLDTFLRNKVIRNIMAQKKGLDFKEILAGNKIVLVKLSQGLIGDENSYLLGTLLLSKLYQAAQARQAIDKTDRRPFYVYLDEFHNFLTPSLSAILSGARKYGLGLVLAHQELLQIEDSKIGNSVLSNPSIRMCYRVGQSDAQKLEKGFSYFDANDIQNLSTGECIVRVERSDWDFNMYTPPLSDEDCNPNAYGIIQQQTRTTYATPVEEIEKLVNELYQFEPSELKRKEKPVIQKPKEETVVVQPEEIPVPIEKEPKEVSPPVVEVKPIVNVEAEDKKYIERVEKERLQREHNHIQLFVRKMAEQRGFKAQAEAPTPNGGRIDILLSRDGLHIACEISVTNTIDYEVKNIQKCMEAGYANVAMLCNSEKHLRNIKQAVHETAIPNIEKVQFLSPEVIGLYLDSFAPKEPEEEVRIKGYRVTVSYHPKED